MVVRVIKKLLCIISGGHTTSKLPFSLFFFGFGWRASAETGLCLLHTRVLFGFCLWNLVFLCDWLHKANETPHLLRGRESRSAVRKTSLVTCYKSTFLQKGTGKSIPPSLAWPITQVCSYWINPLITRQLCNGNEPHPHHNPVFQVKKFPQPQNLLSMHKVMFRVV